MLAVVALLLSSLPDEDDPCRIDRTASWPPGFPIFKSAPDCVQEPDEDERYRNCTFAMPGASLGLPIVVADWRVRRNDALIVNGRKYGADSIGGPESIVPFGDIEWRAHAATASTDERSQFKLCRPRLSDWHIFYCFLLALSTYAWGLFGATIVQVISLVNAVIIMSVVPLVGALLVLPYDGYVFVWMETAYLWEAHVMFRMVVFFPLMINVFGIGCFVWSYLSAARRTKHLERNLRRRLEDGSLQLLSIPWLLRQPDTWRLVRRQDLPKEALVPRDQAVHLLARGRVAALSYRWLSAAHPDPDGFHLAAVRQFFHTFGTSAALTALVTNGAWWQRPEALFWDFASCDQKGVDGARRSLQEQQRFDKALTVMSHVYATPNTLVIQHKRVPHHFPASQPRYDQSGWCTMEQAAASLATVAGGALFELGRGWNTLWARERPDPDAMRKRFHDPTSTVFVGKGDREFVANLYAELHAEVTTYDDEKRIWLVRLSDAIVDKVGVGAALAIFWLGSLSTILFAMLEPVRTNPVPLAMLVHVWVGVCGMPFVPSRKWRASNFRALGACRSAFCGFCCRCAPSACRGGDTTDIVTAAPAFDM